MKQARPLRKRRTREHIIADLSVNHVERFALRAGYTVERPRSDYGIDLTLFSYNELGEIESGLVYLQMKASDTVRFRKRDRAPTCRIHHSDLLRWLKEPQPVIFVLYDATRDVAWWLYVQAYFAGIPGFDLSTLGLTTTVYMDSSHVVDVQAMKLFVQYRNAVAAQQRQVKHDG